MKCDKSVMLVTDFYTTSAMIMFDTVVMSVADPVRGYPL